MDGILFMALTILHAYLGCIAGGMNVCLKLIVLSINDV